MNKITLYTKNNCPQCKMTKRFLNDKHLSYKEINIDAQPQYIDWLKEQGHQTVPVLTTEGLGTIVGFRPDKLRTLAV